MDTPDSDAEMKLSPQLGESGTFQPSWLSLLGRSGPQEPGTGIKGAHEMTFPGCGRSLQTAAGTAQRAGFGLT